MRIVPVLLAAAAVAAVAVAPPAAAVTCTLNVPSFSLPYDINNDATTTVNIVFTCTKQAGDTTVNYRLPMTVGTGAFTGRTMTNGTDTLTYNVFVDNTYSTVWGDGTGGTSQNTGSFDFSALATGAQLSATKVAYVRILSGQDLSTGTYAPATQPMVRARPPTGGPYTGNVAFTNGATIPANCVIDTLGNIVFGTYDPAAAGNIDVSTDLKHRCTRNTAYTVSLSTGASGSFANRTMPSAGANTDVLTYNLYQDGARTLIWGDGTGGTTTVSGTAAGMALVNQITNTIFGRLPPSQDVSADSYSDTITLTIAY